MAWNCLRLSDDMKLRQSGSFGLEFQIARPLSAGPCQLGQ